MLKNVSENTIRFDEKNKGLLFAAAKALKEWLSHIPGLMGKKSNITD
jgi:hypothetical protein